MTNRPAHVPDDAAGRARFETEIWPEAPMLLRSAISLTPASGSAPGSGPRNIAEAEDLVQETLLKAFKHLDRLKPGTNPRAWLLTILRRTWIDRWRRSERRPDGHAIGLGQTAEPHADADPAGEHDDDWTEPEELLARFSDQQIIDALHLLPEGYRWALLLVDVQSLSIEEAADALEVAPGTIKSRLHRGRAMLRDHLHGLAADRGWLSRRGKGVLKEGKTYE